MLFFFCKEKLKNQLGDLPTKDDLNSLDIYVKWPQLEEALNARRSRTPSAKSRASTPKAPSPAPSPPPMTPGPPHPSPEAMEALKQIGELMDKHEDLSDKVEVLEVCCSQCLPLFVRLSIAILTIFISIRSNGYKLQ